MNEAALLAGTNPEVEAAEAAQQRRGRAPEKPPAHDPVLQRALDVVTSPRFIKSDSGPCFDDLIVPELRFTAEPSLAGQSVTVIQS